MMKDFLFGAGCSYGTLGARGAPLANMFGRHLAPKDYPELAKVAEHLGGDLSDLGMEDLWSCIDDYAKFVATAEGGFLPHPRWNLQSAAAELKKAILLLYGRRCEDAARSLGKSTKCTLVDILRRQVRAGDVVVSFNYDTLVERLAKKLGLKLTQCDGRPPKHKVKFVKPHGSASWSLGNPPLSLPTAPILKSLRASAVMRGDLATETDLATDGHEFAPIGAQHSCPLDPHRLGIAHWDREFERTSDLLCMPR